MPKDKSSKSRSQPDRTSSSSSPRKAASSSSTQSSLNSFFKPPPHSAPSKLTKSNGKATSKEEDVIDLISADGVDDMEVTEETDEEMAARLGREELEAVGGGRTSLDKKGKIELDDSLPTPSTSSTRPSDTSEVKKEGSPPFSPPKKMLKSFPMFDKPAPSSTPSSQPSSSSHPPLLPSASKPSPSKGTFTSASSSDSTFKLPPPVFPDLDVDPLVFDPESVDVRSWPGRRVTYAFLVESGFVKIAATKKRLVIGRILTNLLRTVTYHDPASLISTIYLFSNHIFPSYTPSADLGVGSQIISGALKSVTGLSQAALRKLGDKLGDGGDVAFEAKVNVRTIVPPPPLIAHKVYGELVKLAGLKGTGVNKLKGDIVQKLLVSAKGEEVRFLVRTLVQNLRIGAVRLTLTTALARAFTLTRPPLLDDLDHEADSLYLPKSARAGVTSASEVVVGKGKGKNKQSPQEVKVRERWKTICEEAEKLIRRVYVRHPNYDHITSALLSSGPLSSLSSLVPLTLGIPLSPMLGSITRSLDDVFTRLPDLAFTSEAKLDGQRVQVHVRVVDVDEETTIREEVGKGGWWGDHPSMNQDVGGKKRRLFVRLFSRHLEEMTEKYPDIIALLQLLLAHAVPLELSTSPRPTPSSPETIDPLFELQEITSFILDAEIVAIDKTTGAFRTFQELSNRAKKDVQAADVKVGVGVFAFDLMLLNEVPLLDEPLRLRRHLLRTLLPPFDPPLSVTSTSLVARFDHVQSIDSTSSEDVAAFFEECVKKKAEGLMVKLLDGVGKAGDGFDEDEMQGKDGKGKAKAKIVDVESEVEEDDGSDGEEEDIGSGSISSPRKASGKKKALPATYQPDVRSLGWLKVKKDYIEGGIGDSLDLVPVGAWHGSGRKAGWWSPILLACYNPDSGMLEAVCKCISGFSDAFYKDLKARYPEEGEPDVCWKGTKATAGNVDSNGLIPDFWFKPSEVWEIKGADITLSPVYPAAMSALGAERGLSIRFPRFIRIRDDKGWEDATTSDQFADMYRAQSGEGGGMDD